MPSTTPATGFCSVRLESQPYGVLVTVTLNPDLFDRSGDRVVRLTELPEAVELVRVFMTEWLEQRGER